ncbi:MAG: hypothetical protein EOP63_01980 [Sphingomonadales bacterium]|nr:MAG: hypothetical protein EOP63_01980 [Sphingomonadales bacterium]
MSLDPANREALQAVSQLGLQTGHFRESLEATDAILSLAPDEPSALLIRGLHAVIRSRLDEADGYADRILAQDANNEGGVILKARVAVRKGAPKRALEVLANYGVAKPNTLGVAMTRLEIYREMRDAPGMRTQFSLLRTLAPDNRELRLDEANFAFKDGRPRDGAALIAALLADPALPPEQIPMILAVWREYAADGPSDQSLGAVAATGSTAARLAAAEFLADRQGLSGARIVLAGLGPNERAAVDASLAAREGRWPDALRIADQVLSRDETHCLALTARAESLLRSSDAMGALRAAQVAVSQCPGKTGAWAVAAKAYAQREDMENARRMWRQGGRANPQDSSFSRAYTGWLLANRQEREALAVARRLTHEAPALLSGWRLYRDICFKLKQNCVDEAGAGLDNASTIYGVDLLPGQAPPNGLFGRIVSR